LPHNRYVIPAGAHAALVDTVDSHRLHPVTLASSVCPAILRATRDCSPHGLSRGHVAAGAAATAAEISTHAIILGRFPHHTYYCHCYSFFAVTFFRSRTPDLRLSLLFCPPLWFVRSSLKAPERFSDLTCSLYGIKVHCVFALETESEIVALLHTCGNAVSITRCDM
jgi:hypothetical protein